jgi:antitoxin VapB
MRQMALNIKDPATEELARELAALTGEKITHAVKAALKARLNAETRGRRPPPTRPPASGPG